MPGPECRSLEPPTRPSWVGAKAVEACGYPSTMSRIRGFIIFVA